MEPSTQPMRSEAKRAGVYLHPLTGRNYDKVQIVTIAEILEHGKRLDIPLAIEVLKSADAAEDELEQPTFELGAAPHKPKTKMVKASLPLGFQQAKRKPRRRA